MMSLQITTEEKQHTTHSTAQYIKNFKSFFISSMLRKWKVELQVF